MKSPTVVRACNNTICGQGIETIDREHWEISDKQGTARKQKGMSVSCLFMR